MHKKPLHFQESTPAEENTLSGRRERNHIPLAKSLKQKLAVLADAAKYDASCASSGSKVRREGEGVGSTEGMGICHSYTPDGRCVSLLKITDYIVVIIVFWGVGVTAEWGRFPFSWRVENTNTAVQNDILMDFVNCRPYRAVHIWD